MLDAIRAFLDENRVKLEVMRHRLDNLPQVVFRQDRAVMTELLGTTRNHLNDAVTLAKEVELLLGKTEKLFINTKYAMDESKIMFLADAEWQEKKNIKKLAKEERDLLARMENKDLHTALKEIEMFIEEVKSVKRAISAIVSNYESLRKDIIGYVWLLIKDEMWRGGIQAHQLEDNMVEDYLNPKRHN